jgi:hypothetical protein
MALKLEAGTGSTFPTEKYRGLLWPFTGFLLLLVLIWGVSTLILPAPKLFAVLCRQAFPRNRLHNVTESIQFAQGRIHVGCDADALEFVMDDRRCKDSMLVE